MPSARNPEMKAAGQRWRADTGLDAPEKGHFPMNIPENPCKGNLPVSPVPRRRLGPPARLASEKRVNRAVGLIQDHIAQPAAVALAPAQALGAAAVPASLLALWQQAKALNDRLEATERAEDPTAWDAGMTQLILLQDQIAAAPACSPQAWALKILSADDGGAIENTSELGRALVEQARSMIGGAQ